VPRPRDHAELGLPTGSTILLFTDGLFERAGQAIDERLDCVLAEAEARREAPVDELGTGVMDAMLLGRSRADDVCLLAVRLC
jgi:serine phosphatase RsbU (regulator of sigma subunit)